MPGAGRHGRQVGWRDKLMGISFAALLLFGLWWVLLRPSQYLVLREDLSGVLYFTESKNEANHDEFYGHYGQSDVVVIIGRGNEFAVTMQRSAVLLSEMMSSGEHPDADLKQFSNAVVVCELPNACASLSRRVADNAREREGRISSSFN